MRAYTILVASLLALVQSAMATPPACLLAALGKQGNPTDLPVICAGDNMNNNLTEVCSGSGLSAAYSAYSATCSAAGKTVAALPTSSSSANGTPTSTGSGSSSATATGSSSIGSTSSTGTTSSASSTATKQSGASGLSPQPLFFAMSGLFATVLGSLVFP